jgi:hypothetical protein
MIMLPHCVLPLTPFSASAANHDQGSPVRTRLAAGGRRIRTLGPSPKDPLLAGEPKKASSGSSTPRMRLGPQGDRGAKPAPLLRERGANIPAASYCGMACLAGTCKTLTMFHDGTHGLSPGTDGSNPLPSSGESANPRSLSRRSPQVCNRTSRVRSWVSTFGISRIRMPGRWPCAAAFCLGSAAGYALLRLLNIDSLLPGTLPIKR